MKDGSYDRLQGCNILQSSRSDSAIPVIVIGGKYMLRKFHIVLQFQRIFLRNFMGFFTLNHVHFYSNFWNRLASSNITFFTRR